MKKTIKNLIAGISILFFIMLIIMELMIIYMILFIHPITYQSYCSVGRCNSWKVSQVIWTIGALFFGSMIYSIIKNFKRQ